MYSLVLISILTVTWFAEGDRMDISRRRAQYYFNARVGTPVQYLTVGFDSLGNELWLIDSTCDSDWCNTHKKFDPSASKTFTPGTKTFSRSIASATLQGTFGRDLVETSDTPTNISHIPKSMVLFSSDPSDKTLMSRIYPDGYLGLGPIAAAKLLTALGMTEQSYLEYNVDSAANSETSITKPLDTSNGQYRFDFEEIWIGGEKFSTNHKTMTMDTMQPFMEVPGAFVKSLKNKLGATENSSSVPTTYYVDCATTGSANYPTVTLKLGNGVDIKLDATQYTIRLWPEQPQNCYFLLLNGIQSVGTEWTISSKLLEQVNVNVNLADKNINFALRNANE